MNYNIYISTIVITIRPRKLKIIIDHFKILLPKRSIINRGWIGRIQKIRFNTIENRRMTKYFCFNINIKTKVQILLGVSK